MGFFSTTKQIFEDISLWISCNKRRFLLTILLALCGLILGVVIFCSCKQNWWCYNRCNYVQLLLSGNFFSVLLSALFHTCLVLGVMFASHLCKYTFLLKYLSLFIGCLYAGANLACILYYVGVVVVFFLVFYTSLMVIILMIPCFDLDCITEYRKSLLEIWMDCKRHTIVICLLSLARFLLLFFLLRPLSGSI